MYALKGKIEDIENIDNLIDQSFNGTCFAYSWFLNLKNSNEIIKIYDKNNELQGFMPIFAFASSDVISQSTMYIPYGGPIIFKTPKEERNKIRYIRLFEKTLIKFLQSNYKEVNFSTDNEIVDIMPFIRAGFTPEVRYTYKIDLQQGIDKVYQNFGSDRKKDIRKAKKKNLKFVIDDTLKYFDVEKAMVWEKNYGEESTVSFVKNYIMESIKQKKGMCFVALENEKLVGEVHIVWDSKTAYILYSYYDHQKDDVAIPFLYYKIFEYLIDNQIVSFVDFEGSVFEEIEDWNISFGAFQSRFYNLHWNKENKPYLNVYDYGEKEVKL